MARPSSSEHEDLLELLRNAPELMVSLVRAQGLALPHFTVVEPVTEALTQPRPAQLRPDLVLLLRDGEERRVALLVEVQRRIDARKRRTWPLYEVMARNRFHCETLLVVLATNPATARWARQPIPLGNGGSVRPLVLSAAEIPAVTRVEQARQSPELAVLSAIVHASGDPKQALRISVTAVEALAGMSQPLARLYFDFLEHHQAPENRAAWREIIMSIPAGYQWKGAFALEHREAGREEGREEGYADGRRETLIELCQQRFGPLPEWATGRIAEGSSEQLRHWLQRILSAETLEDVLS